MRFALNHIVTPNLPLADFFALAGNLGLSEVEIRNDLPDVVGTTAPETVKAEAERAGVTLLSINALYPFNSWSEELQEKTLALTDYAAASGAKALVMCPLNDGTKVPFDDLVAALRAIKPILDARGITGLVEPLGFPISSLRTKKEAISAIIAAGGGDTFRLVHDTFHHHLAGETDFFPEWTEIVHISGVTDPSIGVAAMLDGHRVLVDEADRLNNIAQIRALHASGFEGPYSYEPFAPEIHALLEPVQSLRASMAHIVGAI
ncbi:MAG: xylose isomerase [Pelagibacterium sp. SCN 64-44]|nr:MAG: xylose isomerase [Pelagibacterium sp. SCN 64-44]